MFLNATVSGITSSKSFLERPNSILLNLLKMRFEIGDPLKEGLRQQRYKELSAHAINLLKNCQDRASHKWHYLLAQCQYNKWDYDVARVSIDKAIATLPDGSYLRQPYERLRAEIVKKRHFFKDYG
jgi:hypothetical protein